MRIEDKEAKRQDIITSARELFISKGYKKVSAREIARKAGISKGNVYDYFKSKDDFLIQTVNGHIEILLDEFENMVAEDTVKGESIEIWKHRCKNLYRKSGNHMRLLFDAGLYLRENTQFQELIIPVYKHIRESVTGLLQKHFSNMSADEADYRILANTIIAFLDGICFQMYFDPENTELDKAIDRFWDGLLVLA